MTDIRGKHFLVTGGTGFVGKNLIPYIINEGAFAVALGSKTDLSNDAIAERTFKDISTYRYDYIIHGAALQAAGEWPVKHRAEQFDANLRIHSNVLRYWHKYQPRAKMVALGSSCSYPGAKEFFCERDFWDGPMHDSVATYGFTKKSIVVGIEAYKAQYGLQGTTVIPATLYGPHDRFDPEKSHVVSALIQKFVRAQENNLPSVEIWGDGTQTREILYIGDQIPGVIAALDYDGPLLNIGSGEATSIRELAEIIKELTKYKGQIVYDTSKFVGNTKKVMDISLAKKLYGWTVEIPIGSVKEGLQKTIEWYRLHK